MSKNIPAAVETQINAMHKRPMLLYEIGLNAGTLRFAAAKTDVVFPTGGNTYTAKYVSFSKFSQSLEGQIGRVSLEFDDVLSDMSAYADTEDFRGKSLVIKRIYLDAMGDASYYNEVFRGTMEQPKMSMDVLEVSATTGKPLNRKVLKGSYQRMCRHLFGDSHCNNNGNADLTSLTASGTADSGSTTTLTDSALTQVSDYWNYGLILITKGGKTYQRDVKDFDADTDTITFDVELPVAVDGTTTYTVYKGCDQTWDTCQSNNVWGPSADNKLNFGGCIHITKKADAS